MKNLLKILGFFPKENTSGVFTKTYPKNGGCIIEVDFEKQTFHFGGKIKIYDKEIQNITKSEDWVVLECVDRLLEKWYHPGDILLEKVYPSGHGTSGRLDILVKKEWKAYLMIECKTWGREFDKELKNLQKDGGQLFTYFQQDRDAEFLTLYASSFENGKIEYKNEIVKVEDSYRETSNVGDFYNRWNKFTKQNGIFESWASAYDFKSKALTLIDLKDIKQSDSSFIFNRFLEILRHNTVSDKPNAFNKMFTLFLCKIYDEWDKREADELEFQWKEWEDDDIVFQMRLSDLYKKWMNALLEKEITDLSNEEFNKKFWWLDDNIRNELLKEFTKLRLQKNNEFAIKEVFDNETFSDNAKVLKEVVELLQSYKIRYSEKQPFLWDFFELLLTTGLKQESGQFFTPVPVARFICKSLPLDKVICNKLEKWVPNDLLPTTIDYAAWSGHFLTEAMEEIQNIISNIDHTSLRPQVAKEIDSYKNFKWAYDYMYGIEKDYRLVKTAKVWCFLHGDGIANVIHWDGLDSFDSKHYRWKLRKEGSENRQENNQFDIVLSNPPYSVSSFKSNFDREKASKDFDLYAKLTDNSSEIECLFIERTKQLLKEWGIAAIILPSSILSNTGIYTRAREILLRNFEIIAVTELGSGTFMATGTNTVVLFMRKRNKYDSSNIEMGVKKFFINFQDVTLNGVENIFSIYVQHIWGWVSFDDYKTLLQKTPNEAIQSSELFKDYSGKIKLTKPEDLFEKIIAIEKEKLLYFVLTYPQKIVLVKSGERQVEKDFLGYDFSFRKWSEWIHPVQKGKQIDECTKLFDPQSLENPKKASTYIYDAFNGEYNRVVDETMKNHIFRISLVDLLTFDRADFENNISLNLKKKIRFEDIWKTEKLVQLSEVSEIWKGTSITKDKVKEGDVPVIAWWQQEAYYHNKSNREGNIITVSASGAYAGFLNYFKTPIFASDCNTIKSKDESKISTKLIFEFLKSIQNEVYWLQRGQAQPHVYGDDLSLIKIPLLPKDIQEKIVADIEKLEKKFEEKGKKIKEKNDEIRNKVINLNFDKNNLENLISLTSGKLLWQKDFIDWEFDVYGWNWKVWKHSTFLISFDTIVIWRVWAHCWAVYKTKWRCWVTDNALYIKEYKKDRVLMDFLFNFLKQHNINQYAKQTSQPFINQEIIWKIKIPLPSLSEQQKIVSEIEKIEVEIWGLKKELEFVDRQKEEVLKKYL